MDTTDVPRHRPLAFDKMETLIKEMQHPETGVPVRSQKLFLSIIPSAFMGYDLIEWLMERFNLDETSNVEAINIANQLCQYGYFFPVNDLKNLVLKDDSSLYRFQTPYYWPWQAPRVGGAGSNAPSLGPDNVEYAIYLVKRTLRNKQRHGLEEYEQEALANLKRNLAAKWDFITMQAEEQVRLAKERKKGDKIVSDSQERAYWRVARPPPGVGGALEPCPVPVRLRHPRPKGRSIHQLTKEIEYLKTSLDRTRVKTSVALEALLAYSETFTPYDPWLSPPQPSNPWVTDDTLFWQINSPLVDVASEKRVQRWAISINELLSDPTGLQEFTSFLRKEYSHENIRFWLAVMDLRRSSAKQIPGKLQDICEEFLKPGAPCEVNIDAATLERVMEGIRAGSRFALDHAAEHVYGLLLKKDCYPRFIRSDHFQRLLAEGKNVHQKKAKFFNFGGGQVKKKPAAAAPGALSRRRGSDRSLSGSAHELSVSAVREPPPCSHSQLNLQHIRDPVEDDTTSDVAPWESSSREGSRHRQDSAADSSSSSDLSSLPPPERARRLPQQSTLDGGLRGAPPPLRRLSAVEPRHLTPLTSPPPPPKPTPPHISHPPHPTPTISVSSAPDDSPPATSLHDDPSSVFTSADATPTDPKTLSELSCDTRTEVRVLETDVDAILGTLDLSEEPEVKEIDVKVEDDAVFAREATKDSPASSKDDKIGDLPKNVPVTAEPSRSEPVKLEVSPLEVPVEKIEVAVTSASVSSTTTAVVVTPAQTVITVVTAPPVETVVVTPPTTAVVDPLPAAVQPGPVTSPDVSTSSTVSRTVAPLAESEDVNVDDDKVPSTSHRRSEHKSAPQPDGTKRIAHKDDLTSVSDTDIVKRDKIGDRKQRNDICPWEDE